MPSPNEIEAILRKEVEKAREEFRATLDGLEEISRAVNDENRSEEESVLKAAAEARIAATRAYNKALQRFHDFLVHGLVPPDLE